MKNKEVAVLSYGRMNPPTEGHRKLVDKVKEEARKRNADHRIVLSHSQDQKKNPLGVDSKLKYAKEFFPNTNLVGASKELPTIMHHAKDLHKSGVKHLVVVAGEDRKEEYEKLLNRYNGKEYNFNKIEVVSAGKRDPNSEGTEGISASKMRDFVVKGDKESFYRGLPKGAKKESGENLYNEIHRTMAQKTEKTHITNKPKTKVKILHSKKISENVCWNGYKQIGMKKKKDKKVPNCVPVQEQILNKVKEKIGHAKSRKEISDRDFVHRQAMIKDKIIDD